MDMLARWWVYLRESLLPASRAAFATLLYLGVSFTYQALRGTAPLAITPDIFPGAATLFLMLLYYRISDEFKDAEVDRRFFPHRPVPSGRVTFRDLRWLMGVCVAALFAINLAWPGARVAFLVLFGYGFLMRHWFFLGKVLAENRLLAFLTHGPISILGNYYILALTCRGLGGLPLFTTDALFTALWFSLTSFAWEFARKTRAPAEEEEGYQTYSRMFGARASAGVSASFTVLQWATLMAVRPQLGLSTVFVVSFSLWVLVCLVPFFRFLQRPERGARTLARATEIYGLLLSLGLLAELVCTHGIAWK